MIALLTLTALAQDYAFPTSSSDYGHWYLSTHVDHSGVDYACGSDRYSGHSGTDYGAGSWSGMSAGRDVNAAADGIVTYVHDGEPDNCAGNCSTDANVVYVEHPDGYTSIYAHLKRWSITVDVGDSIQCGEKLGEMGSSGNSSGPHLHFAVFTPGGQWTDPYAGNCSGSNSRWVQQGAYQGIPGRVCDPNSPGPGGGGCSASLMSGHVAALFLLPLAWRRRRQA